MGLIYQALRWINIVGLCILGVIKFIRFIDILLSRGDFIPVQFFNRAGSGTDRVLYILLVIGLIIFYLLWSAFAYRDHAVGLYVMSAIQIALIIWFYHETFLPEWEGPIMVVFVITSILQGITMQQNLLDTGSNLRI